MAGWDDFVEGGAPSSGERGAGAGLAKLGTQGFEDGTVYTTGGGAAADEEPASPIFTLGQVQFTLPSQLFALSCTNNVLVLACTGVPFPSSSSSSSPPLPPQLIRIDLDRPSEVETIDLPFPSPSAPPAPSSARGGPPPPPQELHKLHVSPSGLHLLLSTKSGENFYLFLGALPASLPSGARKPRHLSRLKGAVIDAVAWSPSPPSSSAPYTTREILLGTASGQILETALLDPALNGDASAFSLPVPGRPQGPEKYVKQLFTLPVREGVVGLRYETWSANGSGRGRNVAVLAATRTRVYQFVGAAPERKRGEDEQGWVEEVFKPYREGDIRPKTLELPGEPLASELHFFAPPRSDGRTMERPKTLAWMTGPGIYHATLTYPSSPDPSEGIIDSASLIPFPALSASSLGGEVPEAPISFALTEFHFVLLYQDRVVAVDLLTDRVVYEEMLELPPATPPLRLVTDPLRRTLWLHTSQAIYELVVKDEDQDVWRVWLRRGEWEKAKAAAKSPQHRSLILAAEADASFAAGRYIPAAQAYAQTDARSFEDVVLRFVEKGERDALRYYLVARLERLKKTDLTQRLMLATWLVEMYLAKLTELEDLAAAERASEDAENFLAERAMVEEDMRGLMGTYKDNLDPTTTFDLLARHGRDELTLFYASLVGDYGRIVQYHVAAQEWTKALRALNKQEDLELYYRFASVLVRHAPKEAVDTFLRQPRLSARRLIPALISPHPRPAFPSASTSSAAPSTSTSPAPEAAAEHLIRYLSHVVLVQGNADSAVHNALLTLYASADPSPALDGAFLHFLSSAPTDPSTQQPYYDLDYALRICRANRKTQACVMIYSKMGLYEESVNLALEQDDLELAKECAEMPLEDEMLRKKLWLKAARHVVGKKNDIKTAMRFLESTPLLKMEDILPFFPEFVIIDDFKDEICGALEGYASHIERLKGDMADATRAADAIKSDIAELDQRFVVVDANEKCGACGGQLLTRQFYVFPCQHCFHADCLIQEVTKTLSPHQLRRMLDLQAQLSPSPSAASAARQAHRQRTLLDDAAAGGAQLKLAAQASVQAVDQLRKLVLPDALLSAIGGAIPVPAMGGKAHRGGTNGRAQPGLAEDEGGATAMSASKRREEKEKEKLRALLDELLAKECVLCEGAIGSIQRGFVDEGEEM
ncbi:hypothetical protein JCM10213_008782 [Rhodosporidiobolus nylandii]